ncbi:MAG: hypothetical protein ACRDJF_05420 [Actinomycetota bacterium]
MRRAVLLAVGLSLGIGGAIVTARLLRRGAVSSPAALSAEARGVLDSVRSTLDAALAEWRRASRETEVELRGQLSSP